MYNILRGSVIGGGFFFYTILAGEKQVVTKTGFSTADLESVYVTYHQYYYVEPLDYWFEFLRVTVDLCKVRARPRYANRI